MKKDKFVQARARGLTRREASAVSGIAGDGSSTDKSPSVQQELAAIRKQMAVDSGVTRDTIVAGLKQAADMAHAMADPQGMVMAWRELGKMLGFYAPEVKKLERGISKRDLLAAMDELSDEELMQLSRGRVIDGKFTKVVESLPAPVPDVQ